MRNIGGIVGIAMVTTLDTRFTQKYVNRLGENVTRFRSRRDAVARPVPLDVVGAGSGPGLADQQSLASMFGMVQRQAAMLAFVELFRVLALVFLLMIPLAVDYEEASQGRACGGGPLMRTGRC